MNSVFEINTVNNVTDVATDRVKKTSPIVEVFSDLAAARLLLLTASSLTRL